MAVAKYKNIKPPNETFTGADRIPPFLPINWVDWESDEHVQDMSEALEGVFWRIIYRVLWKYDTFLLDHNRLAERIRADRRNVKAFLERYGHLFVCSKCGGTPLQGCGKSAVVVSQVCPHCVPSVLQPCSCSAPTLFHEKLKNYKNDVKSGLSLGTTKPEPNLTEPESNLDLSKFEGLTEQTLGEDDDIV